MDQFYAKGKRGVAYLRQDGGKQLLVKRQNPESVVNTIKNEAAFTERLNAVGIGPRFISYDEEKQELLREFIDGKELRKWLPTATASETLSVLLSVLRQCKQMDELGINKLEMTRPWKHIIIRNGEAYLIDFERCRESKEPKNVTQFCQFLTGSRLTYALKEKEITINNKKLLELAKIYKHNMKNNKKEQNKKVFEEMEFQVQDVLR